MLGRWESFLALWPTPEACAAAPLAAVSARMAGSRVPAPRPWAPRNGDGRRGEVAGPRPRAGCANSPALAGTPHEHCWCSHSEHSTVPPQDVNIARVTARAALGKEPDDVRQALSRNSSPTAGLDGMNARDLHLRALRRWRAALQGPTALPRLPARRHLPGPRAPRRTRRRHTGGASRAIAGSTRELRGAVLRVMLAEPTPAHRRAAVARRRARRRPPAERHRSRPRRARPRGIG